MEAKRKSIHGEPLWTREFIIIILISLFTFLGFQMLLPTLPVFAKSLGGGDTSAGLVVGLFTFSAVLIRPFTGYALDAYGRKGVFFIGMLIFAACVLSYTWAPYLLILLFIRFIHGFGWGLTSTAASTVAADLIPKSRLGEGMGYYGLAGTLSMALAPAFGLFIIDKYNFNTLFLIATVMVVVSILLAFTIQYRGAAETEEKGKPKFSLVEKTALRPTLVIFLVTMTYGAIVTFIALYASSRGISNIGPFFTIYAISLALFRPIAGRLADTRGFDFVVIPGLGLILGAMLLLYFSTNLQLFILAAFVYGAGFGTVQPCLQALAIIGAPERRGAANATFFTGFDLGIGLSSIMWGAIAQIMGYSLIYLLATIPVILALAVYIIAGRTAPSQEISQSN